MSRPTDAEAAFVRQAPLPDWARPLPLPEQQPRAVPQPAVQVRLADTQLFAGHLGQVPAYLVNRAEQVNDAGALSQIGQVSLQFNPHYQRLLLHRVAIVRDGHAIDHTADAPVRFLQREAGLEQGVVSGVVTASMVLADVRAGDTLHLTYTVEGENPIFAGRYAGWSGWDQPNPVGLRHVAMIAPEQRRIHWRWLGDRPGLRPQPVESVEGGLRRTGFRAEHLPGVPFEPYLPRDAHPMAWLQFTEFGSWAEVADWARALFPQDDPLPGSLEPVMQRLLSLPSKEEQASAALQWVQQEVRYYSVSLGEGSHRPRSPAEVVSRRYGDCKDKSLLLTRILQALGLQAHPALVSAGTRQGPLKLLPSPEAFDHVIVTLRLHGRDFWLDATRLGQHGPLEHMGQGLEDAAALVVAEGTTELSRVHSPNREHLFANELAERYELVDFERPARLASQQHWHGLGAESLKGMLARMDEAQLAQWALGRYDRRHPGIRLLQAPVVHHDEQLNRLSVSAVYEVPKPLQAGAEEWSLRFFASNLQGAFAIPESLARTLPLAVPSFPGRMQYQVQVRWPEGTGGVVPPHTERLDTPHFSLHVTRSQQGNVARESAVLQPRVAAVAAAELPGLVEDMRRIDDFVHGRFTAPRTSRHPDRTLVTRLDSQLRAQADRAASAISRGHLQGEDLALAHALRAEALAELGEGGSALAEAEAAVAIAPALARAWSSRGQAEWALGRFAEAAGHFGRALQLDGDPAPNYLHRGQALFYEGRFDRAAQDFAQAAALSTEAQQRLHAQVWQGWALRRLGGELPEPLLQLASRTCDDLREAAWPAPALALAAGRLEAGELLSLAGRSTGDEGALALVEAWFSVGQHHLAHGREGLAREAFEKAREGGVTRYAEHAAAGFELQRLQGGR